MILNSNKTFFLSTIKEKIINFICDKFNIADYPNLHDFIDVKQLDIVNIYDEDILYKIKIRLKRHGEVTINNLEEYREVIESVVERPIKFEIIDYMLSISKELKLAYELLHEYRNFNETATVENAEEWLNELILKFQKLLNRRIYSCLETFI